MSILVSGSLAYDYIMDFPDSFKNHILPEYIHILNVSFVVNQLQKNLGGTAGNIAYTMKLLGVDPLILSPIGSDAQDYIAHCTAHGISTKYIKKHTELLTASAHITTDKDDNQITAFYPGALIDDSVTVADVSEPIELAILSPTKKEVTLKHAKECDERNIPFVFDPGQQITAFAPQELMRTIGQATYLIGNDYEIKLLEEKTGWDTQELLNHVDVVIITYGEKGSAVLTKDGKEDIASCSVLSVEDPTGAGDAYRAGFFAALTQGKPLRVCGQVGSVAASFAIEHYGTQRHSFTSKEFGERYAQAYNESFPL